METTRSSSTAWYTDHGPNWLQATALGLTVAVPAALLLQELHTDQQVWKDEAVWVQAHDQPAVVNLPSGTTHDTGMGFQNPGRLG